jgi:hypothetical protein
LTLNSFSGEFLKIVTNDSKEYAGELVERYEDRWFYESTDEGTEKFILLFNDSRKSEKFNLINVKDIKTLRSLELVVRNIKNT